MCTCDDISSQFHDSDTFLFIYDDYMLKLLVQLKIDIRFLKIHFSFLCLSIVQC